MEGSGVKLRILVLHGPNLSRAFLRDLPTEGQKDADAFAAWLAAEGERQGIQVDFDRRAGEGELCQAIEEAPEVYDGIIVSVGLLRYTSLPLWGALRACELPCVEVVPLRERLPMERAPIVPRACLAEISGMGLFGYQAAMEFLRLRAARGKKPVITRPSDR